VVFVDPPSSANTGATSAIRRTVAIIAIVWNFIISTHFWFQFFDNRQSHLLLGNATPVSVTAIPGAKRRQRRKSSKRCKNTLTFELIATFHVQNKKVEEFLSEEKDFTDLYMHMYLKVL
jgi:hypothetical protein